MDINQTEQKLTKEELYSKYPDLFRMNGVKNRSMEWGITIGDGWLQLLDDLCQEIIAHVAETNLNPNDYYFVQVKEKFGGLRVYMSREDDSIEAAIEAAVEQSWRTCEDCGKPARPRDGGWMRTLCDRCEEARQAWSDSRRQQNRGRA